MAGNSQMFARLLPIDIKFFNGESPSPQKMNGIFNYVGAAFYILESFLGNGIDYRMPINNPANRKMLFNLSQVLGNTGKLYKPTNALITSEYLHRNFGIVNKNLGPQDVLHTSHTLYDPDTEILTVRDRINIPICINVPDGETYYLGIYYTGDGSVSVTGGEVGESQTLILSASSFRKFFFFSPSVDYIDYITLSPGAGTLEIESIFLIKESDTLAATERVYERDLAGATTANYIEVLRDYNTSYAVPLDNVAIGYEDPTFWTIKTPCKWAIQGVCSRMTCSKCIGNIYDIDVDSPAVSKIGAPICGGLQTVYTAIHPYLVPKDMRVDTAGQRLEYVANDYSSNPQSQIYTIQSPLLMVEKSYMSKYRPFMAHNLGAGVALTKNESVVYDLSSRTNPVRYNIPIYSAGRPDIVYVFDTNKELVAGSSDKVLILGGAYTITEMIEDLVTAINIERNPQVSVYAD